MSLTGTFRGTTSLTNTKDNVDLSTPTETVGVSISKTIDSGVLYHDSVTLSASQVYIIDVNDNSLSDVYGNTIAISGVTGLYIKSDSTNTGDLTISGITNSMINTLPSFSAGEGITFMCDIDTSSNSKLCVVNGAQEAIIDIVISGDE